jgi:(p)ppGpp synthase/HD superfamily hydrolase
VVADATLQDETRSVVPGCARLPSSLAGWPSVLDLASPANQQLAMSSPWSQDLYIHAYRFAAHAHRWQMQSALLHDTLEDTRVRHEQLLEHFGVAVADGVQALTLNKQLPKRAQMPECLERIQAQRPEIWMVKLADRITNLQPPPPHWSPNRIQDYHQESQGILQALAPASAFLAQRMREKIAEYAAFTTPGSPRR